VNVLSGPFTVHLLLPKSVAASTQLGKTKGSQGRARREKFRPFMGLLGFNWRPPTRVVNRWEGREADGKVAGVEKHPQEN
jgi:hypothetical protein